MATGMKDKLTGALINSHLSNDTCYSPFVDFDKVGSNINGIFCTDINTKHRTGRTTSQSIFTFAL
jgi:hypothetical protein